MTYERAKNYIFCVQFYHPTWRENSTAGPVFLSCSRKGTPPKFKIDTKNDGLTFEKICIAIFIYIQTTGTWVASIFIFQIKRPPLKTNMEPIKLLVSVSSLFQGGPYLGSLPTSTHHETSGFLGAWACERNFRGGAAGVPAVVERKVSFRKTTGKVEMMPLWNLMFFFPSSNFGEKTQIHWIEVSFIFRFFAGVITPHGGGKWWWVSWNFLETFSPIFLWFSEKG